MTIDSDIDGDSTDPATRKSHVASPTSDPIQKLNQLLLDLFNAYPSDASAPGITISRIKSTPHPRVYVAIVRYQKPFGKDKMIVTSSRARKIEDAIDGVAIKWRAQSR